MHKRRSDGSTLHQHYTKLLKMPSERLRMSAQQELKEPPIPPAGEHFLLMFYDVNGTRREGMGGFEPLSWSEVDAYLRLTKQEIEPWEVRLLKRMDRAWLSAANEQEDSQ